MNEFSIGDKVKLINSRENKTYYIVGITEIETGEIKKGSCIINMNQGEEGGKTVHPKEIVKM